MKINGIIFSIIVVSCAERIGNSVARRIFSEMINKELKFLLPRAIVLDVVIYIISLFVYGLCKEVPLGLLAGTAVMLINFIILGLSSERAVERPLRSAKADMFGSYMLRLAIVGVLFYAGIKCSSLNLIACALPQLFPKMAYTLHAALNKKGG